MGAARTADALAAFRSAAAAFDALAARGDATAADAQLWSTTLHNMGNALIELGRAEEAVVSYEALLPY